MPSRPRLRRSGCGLSPREGDDAAETTASQVGRTRKDRSWGCAIQGGHTKAGVGRGFLRGHALCQRRLALRGRTDVCENGAAAAGRCPAVWNTCLVFYQAVLLLGYLYAHLSLKWLGPRRQAALHLLLLCLPWCVLPIGVAEGWLPPPDAFPVPWLWLLLSVPVGLPFLVVSATAPMLQAWFSRNRRSGRPRPLFPLCRQQSGEPASFAQLSVADRIAMDPWRAGHRVGRRLRSADAADRRLCGAVVAIVTGRRGRRSAAQSWYTRRNRLPSVPTCAPASLAGAVAGPSSLLMGVTMYISTDIAAIPLLWVVPLALYLLTFVLVFARRDLSSSLDGSGTAVLARSGRRHDGLARVCADATAVGGRAAPSGVLRHRHGMPRPTCRRPSGRKSLDRVLFVDVVGGRAGRAAQRPGGPPGLFRRGGISADDGGRLPAASLRGAASGSRGMAATVPIARSDPAGLRRGLTDQMGKRGRRGSETGRDRVGHGCGFLSPSPPDAVWPGVAALLATSLYYPVRAKPRAAYRAKLLRRAASRVRSLCGIRIHSCTDRRVTAPKA